MPAVRRISFKIQKKSDLCIKDYSEQTPGLQNAAAGKVMRITLALAVSSEAKMPYRITIWQLAACVLNISFATSSCTHQ